MATRMPTRLATTSAVRTTLSRRAGVFRYSHGFRVFTETTGQKRKGFRSVMAYHCTRKSDPDDCVRVLYSSNPNVTYTGRAEGTRELDNARSIDKTVGEVATFFSQLP